jgi:hypothetical protein
MFAFLKMRRGRLFFGGAGQSAFFAATGNIIAGPLRLFARKFVH